MLSSTANRKTYSGNGVTSAFSFPYYFLGNSDLVVYVDGVEKTLDTHYTVSGAGVEAGGTVTFTAGNIPASGTNNVVIVREPDFTQETDYPSNDRFPSASHEMALDKLTMLAQRLKDLVDRSLTLSDSEINAADLTLPPLVASYVLGVTSDGAELQWVQGLSTGVVTVSSFMATVLDDANAETAVSTISGNNLRMSGTKVGVNRTPASFALEVGGGIYSVDAGAGGTPQFISRAHPSLDIVELGSLGAHPIHFITNSVSQVTIDDDGDVVVGVTSKNGGRQLIVQNVHTGASSYAQFGVASNAGSIVVQQNSTAFGAAASLYSNSGEFNIYTSNSQSLKLGANNNPNMLTISPAGVVNASTSLTENSTRVFSRNSADLGSPPAGQNFSAINTIYTFAHGLGQIPVTYQAWFDCIDGTGNTAGNAYPLNHRIFVNNNCSASTVGITADATNIYVRIAGAVAVVDPSAAGSLVALTTGTKWQINVRGWY